MKGNKHMAQTNSTSKNLGSGGKSSGGAINTMKNSPMMQNLNEQFHLDEILDQASTYIRTATDFAKRRPYLVLGVAAAVGAIGAWAISTKKKAV